MIKINETRKTRSFIAPSGDVYDEYRNYSKEIKLFGIVIWYKSFTHNINYLKSSMSENNMIGFKKTTNNEEDKQK